MARTRPTVWDAAYEAERDAAIVWRTRWAALLCVACLVVACADVTLAHPQAGALRLKFLGAFLALSFLIGAATLRPSGRQNPRLLAMAFGVGIILTLDFYGLAVPNGIAITGASLSATVMGLAILLPWGTLPQAVVSGTAVAAYGGLWLLGGDDTSAIFSIVASAGLVAIVGASLLDRYRRGSFVQAWQQEQVAALGRDLAEQELPTAVAERLVAHAAAMCPADVVLVALVGSDGAQATLRVSRVGGTATSLAEQFLGFEVPYDGPLATEVVSKRVLLMPQDAPDSALGRTLAMQPEVRALYVTLLRGSEVLGVLAWIRRRDFDESERTLAGRLADPAALALKTARLLTDLRESSRLKSEFVSTVSHELRTPLNVILGFAEMARDMAANPPEHDRCLARIETAGRELLTLIESTLEVGRLEAQRSPVRIETVHLPEFWAELRHSCASIPHDAAVRLDWLGDVPDTCIATDPHKLRVIVRNLVGNALKFTTAGHVRATLAIADRRLALSVADTGVGIHPDDQRLIFDMFRQGDGSDARRFGGTGLGLYIVRRFAEQLGATIEVESSPGRGSTFRVTVPIAPATDTTARRAA